VPEVPATRYAKTVEGTYLAYQILGDGPLDEMVTLHSMMHIDLMWEEPAGISTHESSWSWDSRGRVSPLYGE
jgi:hypothetical protein